MSTSPTTFPVAWREDGTATLLGRITARNGTGAATGVAGEGNWIKQADVSTITCKSIDVTNDPTAATTQTITSSAIIDTPVTSTALWTVDSTGYNFLWDAPSSIFATGGHKYRIEVSVTTTGSEVASGVWEGVAQAMLGS